MNTVLTRKFWKNITHIFLILKIFFEIYLGKYSQVQIWLWFKLLNFVLTWKQFENLFTMNILRIEGLDNSKIVKDNIQWYLCFIIMIIMFIDTYNVSKNY